MWFFWFVMMLLESGRAWHFPHWLLYIPLVLILHEYIALLLGLTSFLSY